MILNELSYSEPLIERLTDKMAIFVQYGLVPQVTKYMLPLVRVLLECERPDLAENSNYLDNDVLSTVLWDLNGALCVRRGDLPAQDGSIVYEIHSLFH
jgi:hypothetical protein